MFDDSHAERANAMRKNTLMEALEIHYYVKDGAIVGRMPVESKTKQPVGLLHGGASAALAESVGSVASALLVDLSRFNPVGTSLHVDHLRAVTEGEVHAIAEPIHLGKRLHVWDIPIRDAHDKLIASCRHTVMIIKKT